MCAEQVSQCGLITFFTELRLVCAPSLRDHFAEATVSQSFKAYEGKPLTIPADPGSWPGAGAAGPKSGYPPSFHHGGQSLE